MSSKGKWSSITITMNPNAETNDAAVPGNR